MQYYYFIGFILLIIITLVVFISIKPAKKVPEEFLSHYLFLEKNLKNFNSTLFIRELQLFTKKVISVKFNKPQIYFTNPNLITKIYNWNIVNFLSKINSLDITLELSFKQKNDLLKELKKIL